MKELLLIRHGKSDWDHPGLSDHDRTLNDRGRRDAPRMTGALRQRGIAPDLVLSSTAVRALTTAMMVAEGLDYPVEKIIQIPDLYLAPPRVILHHVQGLDEAAGTALIFGHNPGMHEAMNLFSAEAEIEDFPTLAIARFELQIEHWGNAEWGKGLLLEMITPRSLASE